MNLLETSTPPGSPSIALLFLRAFNPSRNRPEILHLQARSRNSSYEAITPGGPGDFGMVFMPGGYRRTKGDVARIVTALEAVLQAFPGDTDLADAETWL